MSNEQLQQDEIEALTAIYGDDVVFDDESRRSFSITVKKDEENKSEFVLLQITLPPNYPLEAPPMYTFMAPAVSAGNKIHLMNSLEELYCSNVGESILYMWIEKAREYLQKESDNVDKSSSSSEDISCMDEKATESPICLKHRHSTEEEPLIYHGDPIIDRRSTFQAHVAPVVCKDHVKDVTQFLKTNKKIASATHNITAYRISGGPHNTCIQDSDDDGEAHAGARLLHLLQILDVRDVFVMVSRWYGGTQLGPDRFKHINNVARDLLEKSGFLETTGSSNTNSKKKGKRNKK